MPCRNEWKVEKAHTREQLEVVLNALTSAGWEFHSVVSECPAEGFDYTVLFYRVLPAPRMEDDRA
jgi:hypothetical protein